MDEHRRCFVPGGTYFFTVVTAGRRPWLGTDTGRRVLCDALRATQRVEPFDTVALAILPDHVHAVWVLPEGDWDYSSRWKRVKTRCAEAMRAAGTSGERRFWLPGCWERMIHDEADLRRHIDYVHYDPVRHGLAHRPADWSAGTFARCVDLGWYAPDWAGPAELIEAPE